MALAAVAVSCVCGAGVVWAAWPGRGRPASVLLRACLALGLGLGANSAVYFAWLWMSRPGGRAGLIGMDLAAAAMAVAIAIAWFRRGPSTAESDSPAPSIPRWATALLLALAVLVTSLSIYSQVAYAAGRPHGEWDAFAIWNLRARFLFRGGDEWRAGFAGDLAWSHTDYPLLWPAAVARLWTWTGRDATSVPQSMAIGATLLVVATLFAGLWRLRGAAVGAVGLIILLASTSFDILGTTQCADVPLAWAMLATLMLLALALRDGEADAGLLLLAGAAAGCAAWTKNEGMVFAAAAWLATLGWAWRAGGMRRSARAGGVMAVGAAPWFLCTAVQKLTVGGVSDFVAGNSAALVRAHAFDAARHGQIWRAMLSLWAEQVDATALGLAAALVVACWFARRGSVARPRGRQIGPAVVVTTLLLQSLGYYAAYLLTPHDLQWHLKTSVHRIFVQLWPSLVFAVMWLMPDPGEPPGLGDRPRR